jgi:uncharacterized membrane protein
MLDPGAPRVADRSGHHDAVLTPMRPTLLVHIVAGSLGILFGFIALAAAKGGRLHRKSGMVFVYAMVTMALMGSFIAAVRRVAPGANIPVGLLTAYMVVTALITVRPPATGARALDVTLMLFVAGVSLTLLAFGFRVLASETGTLYGMPAFPFLIFGAVGMLATIGDARLIRAGGVHVVRGAPRLARHLWRMSFALLTAAFSFFIGQAKVIPKPIRIYPLLMIPPLVVLVALLYWMWRVRVRRSLRGMVVVRPVEARSA